jgi:phosphatidylinositol alpha-1,6-mannosyltransferase
MSRKPRTDRGREVVIVSKPLAPPWNDSGKNLARDIVAHLPGERFRVFVPRGTTLGLSHAEEEALYRDAGSFAPALSENLRLFARLLLRGPRPSLLHFFFAPNPRSSSAARLLRRRWGVPCVQNVSSEPKEGVDVAPLIFGDRVVVHSDHTKRRLEACGVRGIRRIYPGIEPPRDPGPGAMARARELAGTAGGPVVLYPGDYRFSGAIPALIAAIPAVLRRHPAARFVLACRIKVPEDREFERRMIGELEAAGTRGAVAIVNNVPDFAALVAVSDIAVFPASSLYAKMDIPLALLICLAMGTPLVLSDLGPLREILSRPAGLVVPQGSAEALAGAIIEILSGPDRRRLMGGEGRRLARERFDVRDAAAEYGNLYRELRDEAQR